MVNQRLLFVSFTDTSVRFIFLNTEGFVVVFTGMFLLFCLGVLQFTNNVKAASVVFLSLSVVFDGFHEFFLLSKVVTSTDKSLGIFWVISKSMIKTFKRFASVT